VTMHLEPWELRPDVSGGSTRVKRAARKTKLALTKARISFSVPMWRTFSPRGF
jgi:hypothetical protein